MISEYVRTVGSFLALILGLGLVVAALRIGTDPGRPTTHRTVVPAALAASGVGVLAMSHRLMRSGARDKLSPTAENDDVG